ncbi:MAG TPA: class I SAM-dependent methyltransferase, partial [Chryseolinea sp.]|nr:class I SAM-dependent methyltransferase [Chryseolinea sp.]
MIEIDECPICGCKDLVHFLTCLDHSISRENFQLASCKKCHFILTTPRPDNTQLGRYYLSQAYTSHIGKAKTILDRVYVMARGFTLKWKLSIVEKNTLNSTNKKLLDYGCGTGEFLKVAKARTWTTSGVEPSTTARHEASANVKLDISPSLEEIPSNEKFNAITLWHVLEHVSDLDKTIQELKNLLAKNGTIFIAVPNHTSWDRKKYRNNWAGYDVPRHLWHFSKDNMKMLLEKNEMKLLKIIPMKLDAFYICLLSEKYKANGALTISAIIKAIINGFR